MATIKTCDFKSGMAIYTAAVQLMFISLFARRTLGGASRATLVKDPKEFYPKERKKEEKKIQYNTGTFDIIL